MKTVKTAILAFVITPFFFTACKKEEEQNEEEVITTMIVKCTPIGGGSPVEFTFDDPDGPGGNPPSKQTIALQANKSYTVDLQILNKTTNPATDLTPEIISEGAAHRFYFQQTSGTNIAISNLNNDANGIALGTTSRWTTTSAGNGKVKITLRHYPGNPPNKDAADLVNSTKSNTDIEVEFDTTIN